MAGKLLENVTSNDVWAKAPLKSTRKRRNKKNKKSTSGTADATQKKDNMVTTGDRCPLSIEALAFLQTLQQRQSDLKRGPITVAELLGKPAEASILDRLLEKPFQAVNALNKAAKERPPVPGFPSNIFAKINPAVRPEVLQTAVDVFQDALNNGEGSANKGRSILDNSEQKLPPWIALSPMFPLEDHGNHATQMPSPSSRKNGQSQKSCSNHSMQINSPVQNNSQHKTRKPYFMPYISGELVSRGLASKELIKGALRVNQRNYEESYIDNPEGDDQMDLLIYGMQDRNRGLHGDIVVVRLKNRNNWIVRENLYLAWRKGELNLPCDDDGKPLTVPPVPVPQDENIVEVAIGGITGVKIGKDELNKDVSVHPSAQYTREEMLVMGVQVKSKGNTMECSGDRYSSSIGLLDPSIEALIENLALKKTEKPVSDLTETPNKTPKKAVTQRKGAFRYLADMSDEDWGMPDCCLQKTAEVVYIAEQKNCRAAMGYLKPMNDINKNWALFSPTDSRMPRMMIPAEQLPQGFFDRPQDFLKFIFVARLVDWQAMNQFARGRLERSLGIAGDPEVESEGLLFANNVDTREFPPSALKSLPIPENESWKIPESELNERRDFRDEVVFTIDPKTARDLDDALHIKYCEDVDGKGKPGWEVGVHIADVTYFLQEDTELDEWATARATSVYLVHKVIPMLPRILCEELCSLKSGVDRLTFSAIFKIDDEGNVYSNTFERSVIRSKVKLSYEHAQDFIENPTKDFTVDELPEISDNVCISTIKEKVLQLNSIALKLKSHRIENGALRLDQPKLKFALDEATNMPNGVMIYEIKDANRLVEEYMLLANMAVARKIEEAFPSTALLRRHPSPKQKVMREVLEICEKIGFPLDATSSGLLSSSLNKYLGDSTLMRSINQVLSMLMMKPMQLAQYFCVGTMTTKSDYAHYALSCPFYTHFTSPIRRYADVIVHRFLAAAIGCGHAPNMSIQEIQKVADHCNDKKLAAKTVSEGSDETFFALFIKECGPITERAVVVNVLDRAFDVLVFKYGVIKRVYIDKLDMARDPIFVVGPPSKLVLFWNNDNGIVEQHIQMCTIVTVVLSESSEGLKYQAVVKSDSAKDTKTLRQLLDAGISLDSKT